ncbi:hypothetical protein [Pseudobdellovibrio exovorus]|uniref:Uncharacterized protein n=1 Tax=Pseudobdellovibrio exovorus JSS TaxID=1184267 RepID=M4VC18_9BACT|nr:hypothetical protein [Pseudobdellovibrio exovorus]AGH95566.1 hypothetical protein A11Q_1350 [Pseudobdellovibrio exovorus JSS]
MSFLKSVSNFLFGKDADIFDDKGRVLHKLPKKKWDDWHNRIIRGSEYNWREHTGSQAGAKDQTPESQKKSQ